MTPKNETPIDIDLAAEALQICVEGDRCVDNAGSLFQIHDYQAAIDTVTEYIEQYSSFFTQDLPINPIIESAGYAFVRVNLLRILVMYEWCRVETAVRNQLMPLIRSILIAMSEWPEDFFGEKETEFFQDMRRRFRL